MRRLGWGKNRGPKATPPAPITSRAPVMVSGFWSLRTNPATPIFFACDRTNGIGEAGKHHDLCVGMATTHHPGSVKTAAIRETNVQQAHVGPVRGYGHNAVSGARRDSHYLMTARLEHGAERFTQNAVVVTHNKAHLLSSLARIAARGSQRLTRPPPRLPRPHSSLPPRLTACRATADRPSPKPLESRPKPGPLSSTVSNIRLFCLQTSVVTVPAGPAARVALASKLAAIRRRTTGYSWTRYGLRRPYQNQVTRPRHPLGGCCLVDNSYDVSMPSIRLARAGPLEPVVDHVRLPLSQSHDLFQGRACLI